MRDHEKNSISESVCFYESIDDMSLSKVIAT